MESVNLFLYSASPRRGELLRRIGIDFVPFPVDADESIPGDRSSGEIVSIIARRKLEAGIKAHPSHGDFWGLAADTLVQGPEGLLGKPETEEKAVSMLQSLSGLTHKVYTGIAVYSPEKENGNECYHTPGPSPGPGVAQATPCSAAEPQGMKPYFPGTHSDQGSYRRRKPRNDPDRMNKFTPLISLGNQIRSFSHVTAVEFRKLSDKDIDNYIKTGEWKGVAGAYRIQERGATLVEGIDGLWSTVVGLPLSPLYGILTAMSYPFG